MHSVDDAHLVMCRWAELRAMPDWKMTEAWKVRGVDVALSRVPALVGMIASAYYHPDRGVLGGRGYGAAEVEVAVTLRESLTTVCAALVHARLAVAYVLDDISDERAIAAKKAFAEAIDCGLEVAECG